MRKGTGRGRAQRSKAVRAAVTQGDATLTRYEAHETARSIVDREMAANGFSPDDGYPRSWGAVGTMGVTYRGEGMAPVVVAMRWANGGEPPAMRGDDVRRGRRLALAWLAEHPEDSEVSVRLALVRVDAGTADVLPVCAVTVR